VVINRPPAEVAVHAATDPSHELFLMCDDPAATMAHLTVPGATFGPIHQERWGRIATMDKARRCATADLSALAAESDPARLSTCRSLRLARLGGPQGDELSFAEPEWPKGCGHQSLPAQRHAPEQEARAVAWLE
jgi:hypothetical protein